jgi:Spy/CpxP family protein refolding chaperone
VKRGWLVVALLLSLGVNLGLVGVAVARRAGFERWERMQRGEAPPPEALGRRLAERLGVPEARRERFLAIQRQLVERTVEVRREVMRVRLALRRELLAPQPDRARVDALLAELAEREAALNRAFVTSVLDSRELLAGRELELYLRFLERAGPGGFGRGHGMGEGPPRRPPMGRP